MTMTPILLDSLLGVHAVSTLMLAGLIWVVQCVHYPLFALVGEDVFKRYEFEHTRRITRLVAPLMLFEAASAAALIFVIEAPFARTLCVVGLTLLLVNWLSTAFLQVPCHNRLSRGFDGAALHRLLATNWIRTAAWTARGVMSIVLIRLVN